MNGMISSRDSQKMGNLGQSDPSRAFAMALEDLRGPEDLGLRRSASSGFRCMECGRKIARGRRSCSKCGSYDIDLA